MYKTMEIIDGKVLYDAGGCHTGILYTSDGYNLSAAGKPIKALLSANLETILRKVQINRLDEDDLEMDDDKQEFNYFKDELIKVFKGDKSIWKIASVAPHPGGIYLELRSKILEKLRSSVDQIRESGYKELKIEYQSLNKDCLPYFIVEIPSTNDSLTLCFYQGENYEKRKQGLTVCWDSTSRAWQEQKCSIKFEKSFLEKEKFELRWADEECEDMIIDKYESWVKF